MGRPKTVECDIWLLIDTVTDDEGKFKDVCLMTNLKDEEATIKLIDAFLKTRMGMGRDERKYDNKTRLYEIDLGFSTSDNTFSWIQNCGNVDLAFGILFVVLKRLIERVNKLQERKPKILDALGNIIK